MKWNGVGIDCTCRDNHPIYCIALMWDNPLAVKNVRPLRQQLNSRNSTFPRSGKWNVDIISGIHSVSAQSTPGPSCSKLTKSLVNVSLKFQTLISKICQYFLLKKCEKLLHFSFFEQKISAYLVIKS